jgi:hypothetical protein
MKKIIIVTALFFCHPTSLPMLMHAEGIIVEVSYRIATKQKRQFFL